jgi:hypothetical protein
MMSSPALRLQVLKLPAVGSKRFLTNKVDRSVSGLVAQQQYAPDRTLHALNRVWWIILTTSLGLAFPDALAHCSCRWRIFL